MHKSHENRYNTSVQFKWFAKNFIILLLNSLRILTNLNLKLMGYSTENTIFGIIKLKTKLNLAY